MVFANSVTSAPRRSLLVRMAGECGLSGTDIPAESILENTMNHDTELQQAVQAELSWEPSVIAAHIGVAANAGVVTLTGHVETYASKFAAETATRRVKGVKAVAEEIEVKLPYDIKRT